MGTLGFWCNVVPTFDSGHLTALVVQIVGTEFSNHRIMEMGWIRRGPKDDLVQTHLPWAGTLPTRPDFSKPHSA